MASLEQMIGTNENAYSVPERMQQSKGSRKPVGDVINSHSSRPRGNGKSSAKPFNGLKVQQTVLTSTKTGRKRLREPSNSHKPQEKKSSEKYNWLFEVPDQILPAISMDYILEPEEDSSSSLFTPELTPELPTEQSIDAEWEIEKLELAMMGHRHQSPAPPRGTNAFSVDTKLP